MLSIQKLLPPMGRFTCRAHLLTERRSPRAPRLLVTLRQCPVARAKPLTGGIVDLHGNALSGTLLREALHVGRLPVSQEVLEPVEQLWEFSV